VRSACHSERPTTGTPGQSGSLGSCMLERAQSAFTLVRALENNPELVVRGGVEPPTFRFSGCGITVQDRPRRSLCLLIGLKHTRMDAGVRGCSETKNETAQIDPPAGRAACRLGMRCESPPRAAARYCALVTAAVGRPATTAVTVTAAGSAAMARETPAATDSARASGETYAFASPLDSFPG